MLDNSIDNHELPDRIESYNREIIKVIGVGSGGINAVAGMLSKLKDVEFWAIDTDTTNGMDRTPIPNTLTLRDKSEWEAKISTAIKDADLVFLVAGMGGKNGLDAIMEVARVSKQVIGALTVGVVTRPFSFEGTERCARAAIGIEQLVSQVDTLVTISNDKLLLKNENSISNQAAFIRANKIVQSAVQCISDMMMMHGMLIVDFADVRSVLGDAGLAHFGIGEGEGKSKANDAASQAISSPRLECSIESAKSIIVSVTGGSDMSLPELITAVDTVHELVDPNASFIINAVVDERMEDKIHVSIIVTGFTNI